MRRSRNKILAKSYQGKPCAACGTEFSTVGDHIKTFGSGGECHTDNMWPLCFKHHRQKEDKGLNNLIKDFPHLKEILRQKNWVFDEFSNKWIRITKDG